MKSEVKEQDEDWSEICMVCTRKSKGEQTNKREGKICNIKRGFISYFYSLLILLIITIQWKTKMNSHTTILSIKYTYLTYVTVKNQNLKKVYLTN